MNYKGIGDKFDLLCRTAGLTGYDKHKNEWINEANAELCQEFEVPSLKITETRNASANSDVQLFPYVYDGSDVSIYYDGRRLDYQPEEGLDLAYTRRTGNKGRVQRYDWAGIVGSPSTATEPGTPHGVILENRSPIVRAFGAFTFNSSHVNEWVRFDPFTDADSVEQNPGEFGYKIQAVGTDAIGNYARLEEPYRGPSSTAAYPASLSIRPKETQIFRVYGNPDNSTDEFTVKCFRRPRRLYNSEDTPEYPRLGLAIANIAVAIGLRHLQQYEKAELLRRDGLAMLASVKRRRHHVEKTTPDLPRTGISGRRTSLTEIRNPRYGGIR